MPSQHVPLRFLILDDEPGITGALVRLLGHAFDATIHTASTGIEALRLLRTEHYDVLVTDVNHPPPDGIEVLQTIRSNPTLARLPVIVASAAIPRREADALRAGANAVLQKPYMTADLVRAITDVLPVARSPDVSLLWLGTETPTLDYKESAPLSTKAERARLAKDVIAMANVGGGTIIVGVAEKPRKGRFQPVGLSEDEQAALETTALNKALRRYVDPPVPVQSRVVDHDGKGFVFIDVPSGGADLIMPATAHPEEGLYMGRIYGRTTAAESAPLEKSVEIRAVISRMVRDRRGRMDF